MSIILFVDDAKQIREQYAYDIERKTNHQVVTAEQGKEALRMLSDEPVDLMILDLEMPEMSGMEVLEKLSRDGSLPVPVIVYTGKGDFRKAVRAVKLGAYNFFDKGEVQLDQLVQEINNALEQHRLSRENQDLRRATGKDSPLVGNSRVMQELQNQITKVARVPSNVVITGESGTGKELVAREIHRLSTRADEAFVAVNCAALPENLVESELFGYEKGAFSGADKTTKGKFEVADGGTLLLDEVGEMPISVQAKLLRVLQENKVTRLGGEAREIEINVRVIGASNSDLNHAMEEDRFREDLYYRICTHVIEVPPLRDRIEDIGPLTMHFVQRTCEEFGIPEKSVHDDTIQVLRDYSWNRNNVRELQNIVERMIIQCEGEVLLPEHVPAGIRESGEIPEDYSGKSYQELKYEAERRILLNALEDHDWHITNTAKDLEISNHSNLLKMMRRLDIERPEDS